ncbi:putative transcription factor MADS-type1 family [Helianthus annuus]|nr:putative transcription factor MADS-type1 family [Helianthus annuus]KAJ0919549.1 putative transcription factor MADS-type1 family [Helianthus annuus]
MIHLGGTRVLHMFIGGYDRFEDMGRAKIAMEPIQNDKKRKITFNTRKQGLVKKARELATLCDVDVSMIISTDDQEITPQIFPPDSDQPFDRFV